MGDDQDRRYYEIAKAAYPNRVGDYETFKRDLDLGRSLVELAEQEGRRALDAATKEEVSEIVRSGGKKVREKAGGSRDALEYAEGVTISGFSAFGPSPGPFDPAVTAWRIVGYAIQERCSNCQKIARIWDEQCPHCGVDLAGSTK